MGQVPSASRRGRAGTYFYWAETTGASYVNRRGIDSQLTGAFVVDPSRPEDRVDDRIFVITEWREFPVVGVKYRFRLINITPDFTAVVSLRADGAPLQWKALAKGGADLPPAQAVKRQAQQVISVGETYDFEFESATPGELRLEVVRRGLSAFLTSTVVRVAR